MLNQFSRTELLLGKEAMDKLELEVMYVKHWSEAA